MVTDLHPRRQALAAVHEFLRFQIRDHGTGDPDRVRWGPCRNGAVVPLRSAQLARLAGVSADTLRVYEAKGLLPPARRSRERLPRVPAGGAARACGWCGARWRSASPSTSWRSIVKVRDRGGAPCAEVRALAAEKLALIEARLAEMQDARDRLRGVLERWDALLAVTPEGGRAALLDAPGGAGGAGNAVALRPPRPARRSRGPEWGGLDGRAATARRTGPSECRAQPSTRPHHSSGSTLAASSAATQTASAKGRRNGRLLLVAGVDDHRLQDAGVVVGGDGRVDRAHHREPVDREPFSMMAANT